MDDRLDLLLTGVMPAILMVAVALTLLISLLLLHIYRRAVVRSMGRSSQVSSDASSQASSQASGQTPAEFAVATAVPSNQTLSSGDKTALYAHLLKAPWRQAVIYGMGGLGYAVVMSLALQLSFPGPIVPIQFLCTLLLYLWPTVIAFALVAASTRKVLTRLILAYFMGLIGVSFVADWMSGPTFIWMNLLLLWFLFNGPATALLLGCLHPRIRAVGPLVLTSLLFVVSGFLAFLFLIRSQDFLVSGVVLGASVSGQDAFLLLLGIAFCLSLVFVAPLGWGVLRWIRVGYEQKRISDQFLRLVSIGLLFSLVHSINLASMSGSVWILSGLPAFAVFLWISKTLLDRQGELSVHAGNGMNLLLLRVFALERRSEQLFQSLSLHWRHIGSIQMIAGPDLVKTTIEPHEFLDFVTGKLARRFIDGPQTLEQRLAESDLRPDLDQRFRVNDFFCYDDTWRLTLLSLLKTSDVVLMDLRSFSRQRAGCIFEINTLIHRVPVEQFTLLVDRTTDEAFLQETIQLAWQSQPPESPNTLKSVDTLQIFRWDSGASPLFALFRVLFGTTVPSANASPAKPA
ncbi:MAG: hypothetical protein AAGC93_06550 [Cyanobacteria bacterium P01_F01_bin.53]